ncbi:aminotransferase class I/II-fold pyridoxal phosphate-dependent enzyme [Streptacidiphilus sp. ASG 303]|uniref:aminotransferase class I/II-fold pyridoxal phosphate-dependent enzyme n=1 Tax=Streptacidiphilus sp. ASG 303 TaxID=2896847 RepID=UPI001E3876BF|nr:aminotransferase class I/II-fold pyridoxal phosphate-dependent enzyme [Streptacidiphilus sp. ASG 303]MCD0485896.1 aminotransferase class I/II-fold pyridoxal phosphate-dependent enzyme [Streptacidiphilus sp. ASG 303]
MLEQHRIRGRRASEIAADVEQAVAAGRLAPGSPLPPLRRLATELGVNPNTAAAAYRLLRDRGVIETGGRRGTRVLPRPTHTPRDQPRFDVPDGVRDLTDGNPDPALLPPLADALAFAAGEQLRDPVLYGHPTMDPGLLAVARREFTADGLPGESTAVASGALDAIERVLQTRLRPGDLVAVEDPGWGSLHDLLPALGLRMTGVGVDDDGPSPQDVAQAVAAGAAALVITSRAQNPTGATVGAARAAELRAVLADRPDVLLVEDDFGHVIADTPYHPVCAADGRPIVRHWTVVRSVTKLLGPDMRLAVLTGDADTVDRLRGRQRLGTGWVSHVLQRAAARLLEDASVDRARVAAHYTERRRALIRALAAEGVPALGRSGFNVWIPVRDEASAVVALLQRGWAVAPGAPFRLRSGPGLRLTVTGLAPAEVPALAADLAAVFRGDPERGRLT